MLARLATRKAVVEPLQVTFQLRLQLTNLFGVHAKTSMLEWIANRFANFPNSRNINLAQ